MGCVEMGNRTRVFYLLMLRLHVTAAEPGAWWNDAGRGIKIK